MTICTMGNTNRHRPHLAHAQAADKIGVDGVVECGDQHTDHGRYA